MKNINEGSDLTQKLLAGVNKLSTAVGSTLGPRGRNVLIREKDRPPFITKDGVTVAKHFSLEDPIEDAVAEIVKQVSRRTNSEAGDGTTTSTVLAHALYESSIDTLREDSTISPIQLSRGLDKVVSRVLNDARSFVKDIATLDDIRHVATVSSNNDESIGNLIATAVDKVGHEGSITIEESRTSETTLELVEGFRLDSGYASSSFVTDERKRTLFYESPMFLVTDSKIDAIDQILPSLEIAARESRPFVVVCEDIEGQALAALIMNSARGTMKVAAIKAPGYGEDRRQILEDLAVSVGAKFFQRVNGDKIQNISLKDFGNAKSIMCSNIDSVITDGDTDQTKLIQRVESLVEQIKVADLKDAEPLTRRLIRLQSSIATIKVGGNSEIEVTEKRHRIEDALEAVRSAQEEGIVPGGSSCYRTLARVLTKATPEEYDLSPEQAPCLSIVADALNYPTVVMASNSGMSACETIDLINSEDGFDFLALEKCDLYERGIIDPFKVIRVSLKNATSVAKTLLTTNVSIVEDASN